MELQDFIETTLIQIVEGVKNAQKSCWGKNAIVSPGIVNTDVRRTSYIGTNYTVNDVEFEVSLTIEGSSEDKKRIGVAFGVSGFGLSTGSGNKENTNKQSLNKVRFSVPIGLPPFPSEFCEKQVR